MPCSICRHPNHNKRVCPMSKEVDAVCPICKKPGHNKGKCTYKALYDTLAFLPKVIIDMIHGFRCSYDEFDSTKSYYRRVVLIRLRGNQVLTNMNIITEVTEKYINPDKPVEIRKIEFVKLLDYIIDRKHTFQKLFLAFPSIKNIIQAKIKSLHDHNYPNMTLYNNLIFGN